MQQQPPRSHHIPRSSSSNSSQSVSAPQRNSKNHQPAIHPPTNRIQSDVIILSIRIHDINRLLEFFVFSCKSDYLILSIPPPPLPNNSSESSIYHQYHPSSSSSTVSPFHPPHCQLSHTFETDNASMLLVARLLWSASNLIVCT